MLLQSCPPPPPPPSSEDRTLVSSRLPISVIPPVATLVRRGERLWRPESRLSGATCIAPAVVPLAPHSVLDRCSPHASGATTLGGFRARAEVCVCVASLARVLHKRLTATRGASCNIVLVSCLYTALFVGRVSRCGGLWGDALRLVHMS